MFVEVVSVATLALVTFDIAPWSTLLGSVACALGWAIAYDALSRCAFTYGGPKARLMQWSEDVETFSRSSGYVSFFHQWVTFLIVFVACLIFYRGSRWEAFWSGPIDGVSMIWLPRQLFLSMIGYEAKDFLPGRGLDFGFSLHHMFVFLGCAVCLLAESSVGLLVVNTFVAESGSAFYNIYWLFPAGRLTRTVYMITMTFSNLFALWAAAKFSEDNNNSPWIRMVYGVVVLLLFILRSIGQILHLNKWRRNGNS